MEKEIKKNEKKELIKKLKEFFIITPPINKLNNYEAA